MHRHIRASQHRALPTGRGFSFIEILAVISIVGIVGVAAIASMAPSRQAKQRAAARGLAAGITYVRERALTTGRSTWCYVYTNTEKIDYYETISGTVTSITDPATNAQLSTILGASSWNNQYTDTAIGTVNGATSASAIIFGFDWQGRLVDSGGSLYSTARTITVTQSGQTDITLTIAAETGLVTIAW